MPLNIPGLTDAPPATNPTPVSSSDPNAANGASTASPVMQLDTIGPSEATNFMDIPATLRTLAASPSGKSPPSAATQAPVWKGWDDHPRGINANLGDTESALHLFYERHPDLKGKPPADGTKEAAELKSLHLWADAHRLAKTPDLAETQWSQPVYHSKADDELARKLFLEQHKSLHGTIPRTGKISEQFSAFRNYVAQNKYNHTIDEAVTKYKSVDARTLKAQLVQESNLDPTAANQYGYTGIAQLGQRAAHDVNLATSGPNGDERLDPYKAIPAAANYLHTTESTLEPYFADYGSPQGTERDKFVLGAYNGGAGTVGYAQQLTYERAYSSAKAKGLNDVAARKAAHETAARWDSVRQPTSYPSSSPLYISAKTNIPANPLEKYHEIYNYGVEIVERAQQ